MVPFLVGTEPAGKDYNVWGIFFFMINTGHCAFDKCVRSKPLNTEYEYLLALLFTPLNVVLVHFIIMSKLGAKQVEAASVEAPHLDALKGDTSPTRRDEIPWVTTPIDIGALADNFFRVSVGNPQREVPESPIPGAG